GASVYAGLAVCSVSAGNLCTATFESVSITTPDTFAPAFPRLGIYAIGGDQSYPAAVRPVLAKFHVVIMSGAWETWDNGRAWTREDVVAGIKSASTIGTKVFQYVNFNESRPSGDPQIWFPSFFSLTNTNNWWLYNNGTSGTKTGSPYDASWWLLNLTHNAPVDPVTGLRPYQAAAQFAYDEFVDAASPNAAPSLDGFFLDNVFWEPRTSGGNIGDWNRDGTSDTNNAALQLAVRTGQKDFFDQLAMLMPGKLQLGNTADWGNASTTNVNAVAPLNGALHGGILEWATGRSFSTETWGGTETLIAWYKYLMDAAGDPKIVLFNQARLGPFTASDVSVANPGADPYDSTSYQAMRYGMACALMNDGYYNACGYTHYATQSLIQWYDEFDAAGVGTGYLGYPVAGANGDVQTGPRWPTKGTHGLWAREFSGGLVLMNPKGNGSQTVTISELGGNTVWKHIDGTQAAVNDGSNVTGNITLAARDGLILLRR
ncbi:MAG TPA: putative glycoside hydrolase, partial [Opitutus sp.]|nr:putative glycoside hydrolase [Opitutus sp.]